jgi:hypothetical protein
MHSVTKTPSLCLWLFVSLLSASGCILVFRVTSNKDLADNDSVKQTKERRWLWEKVNLKRL